jgi:hypothetical protein
METIILAGINMYLIRVQFQILMLHHAVWQKEKKGGIYEIFQPMLTLLV